MTKKNAFLISTALVLMSSNALAISFAPLCGDFYLGAFGGAGTSNSIDVSQTGIALFPASAGGPLDVNATGSSSSKPISIWGGHVGYEWKNGLSNRPAVWNLFPALELEGYYLRSGTRHASLDNANVRLPEHDFEDSFPMRAGVFLANTVWGIKFPCNNIFQPYVGGGLGTARISLHGADSPQVSPPEPGINHFNSDTDASDWTFAAQAKAGVRFRIACHARLFAEYRFLYLSPTHYTFGSTQYPTHAPTTPWDVRFSNLRYNMGVVGIDFL